jgi:hypothetical protein
MICSAAPVERAPLADWGNAIKDRDFEFNSAQAGIAACAAVARKAGAKVTTAGDPTRGSISLEVVVEGVKPVTVLAHSESSFAIHERTLYFANFTPYSSGCTLVAYDLKTGKKLWGQNLEGLGPIDHTKYRNRVALAVEKHPTAKAWGVVATGWESAGRYLEVLDPKTGKQLAHKKYD